MAHLYLADADLVALLKGDVLANASETMRVDELERASHEVDTYLRRGGYTVPLTGTIDPALEGVVFDLVNYRLHVKLDYVDADVTKTALYLDYKAALAWLKAVAAGEVELDVDTEGEEPESLGAVVKTRTSRGWLDDL